MKNLYEFNSVKNNLQILLALNYYLLIYSIKLINNKKGNYETI